MAKWARQPAIAADCTLVGSWPGAQNGGIRPKKAWEHCSSEWRDLTERPHERLCAGAGAVAGPSGRRVLSGRGVLGGWRIVAAQHQADRADPQVALHDQRDPPLVGGKPGSHGKGLLARDCGPVLVHAGDGAVDPDEIVGPEVERGEQIFEQIAEEELGTFYLTDYLAAHFDRLVIDGMGLSKYPAMKEMMFGNYKRMLYLSQTENAEIVAKAKAAADYLGLEYEHRHTGYGDLQSSLRDQVIASSAQQFSSAQQ